MLGYMCQEESTKNRRSGKLEWRGNIGVLGQLVKGLGIGLAWDLRWSWLQIAGVSGQWIAGSIGTETELKQYSKWM